MRIRSRFSPFQLVSLINTYHPGLPSNVGSTSIHQYAHSLSLLMPPGCPQHLTFMPRLCSPPGTLSRCPHSKKCQQTSSGIGVTNSGGIWEWWGCGTGGRGQWTWWEWAGVGLGGSERSFPTLMILWFHKQVSKASPSLGKPNHHDSMVLWKAIAIRGAEKCQLNADQWCFLARNNLRAEKAERSVTRSWNIL